ncbi:MAG: hypothetical protein M1820_004946 [Bogoriella megaspora]|nr:MAG: hypothetical protein M1820_004946 [Bogoriella megaspora]
MAELDKFFELRAQAGQPIVKDAPKFDLESYIANYDGRTRIDRLALIGNCCYPLSVEAFRSAVHEARNGKDVEYYLWACQRLQQVAPDDADAFIDTAWAEKRAKELKAEGDRLEAELKGYKNNLIKESIRMGNEDLGNYYYQVGDFGSAIKAYTRMRDYATLPKHIAEMTLRQTLACIAQGAWTIASSHLTKLRGLQPTLTAGDKPKFENIGHALAGLAEMCAKAYKEAAAFFLRVDPQVFTTNPSPGTEQVVAGIVWTRAVLTPNDIAVYGGLCALASMSRTDLQSRVLDNPTFRSFLELEPHVRRAITFFINAKYSQCLSILESYRTDWLLDIYLQPLVAELFAMVRQKCIVQYFQAYSRVSFHEMARQFPVPETGSTGGPEVVGATTAPETASPAQVQTMKDELLGLIESGVLPARLDLVDNVLVAPPTNPRREVLLEALDSAEQYERTLIHRLTRMNMIEAGLIMKPQGQGGAATDALDEYTRARQGIRSRGGGGR